MTRALLALFAAGCSVTVGQSVQGSARIASQRGWCSAVAIGPNHIATAGHCLGLLEDAEHRIEVPGQGVYRGVLWLRGGPDAALVVTDRGLTEWAELGNRPEADATVRYVSARGVDHECLVTTSWSTWVVASCTPWAKPGDSGSPVTGEDGRVWGVLSSGVGPATVFVPLATLRWGK